MHSTTPSSVYWIALGAFALGMASFVTAGLVPMIEQSFSVSVAAAAQLVTVFALAYGIGSPVCVALLPAHRQRFGLLSALGFLFWLMWPALSLMTLPCCWYVVHLPGLGPVFIWQPESRLVRRSLNHTGAVERLLSSWPEWPVGPFWVSL